MSVIFLGDIALTFNTAVLVDGKWVTSRCTIAQRYCSGWFWVDAPSSIPVELIELAMPHGSDTGVLGAFRFLRVFRLVRLIRLLKVEKYISSLEEYLETSLRALGLLQIFFKLVFIAHLLACGFYYVGTLAGDETSWIESYDERAASGSLSTQYLVCFYWSLTTLTTVGYGDITPVTDVERQFTIFALLVGALVFATLVGDITSLLDALNQQNKLVEERMQSLKEYLEWRQIPRDLSIRIRRYYEYYYTKRPVFDEHLILNGLNPTLHSEMVQHIVKNTLGRAPIAELLSPDFKKALFPLLKPLSMSAGEIIFRRGAPSHDLLFLLDGEVEVFSEIDDTLPATLNALVKRSGAGANAPRTVPADSPITFREIRPMFEKLTSRIDAMEKKLDAMAEEKPDESIHGERTYLSLMSADVSA